MKVHRAALAALTAVMLYSPKKSNCERAQTPLAHVRNSFDLIVHARYPAAAALFGPNGERGWRADNWDPDFLYPQPGEDVAGAVFAIQHGAQRSIWVNTIFDIEAHHFQYVYVVPGVLVTTIDVNFVPRMIGFGSDEYIGGRSGQTGRTPK